jgi:pimeloyl-ACP methyl ester carboxylesterase
VIPARVPLLLAGLLAASVSPALPLWAAVPLGDPAVVSRGQGPCVVLLSGLLGGTARLAPLADKLVAEGFRVVAVDPYRLAADAPDVSFAGMAATLAAALEGEGVRGAIVVAHAHAAGIALRLAADRPALVTQLLLLDAGVVAHTRSPGVERALRVASLVARLPGGAHVVRARLLAGIRANSGREEWLDAATARAYADPLLADLASVARFAERLAAAREPEPLRHVLARVRVDVTALLGAAPHATAADAEELALLRQIPGARVRLAAGVGHFVHEEAPQAVVDEILAARAVLARR